MAKCPKCGEEILFLTEVETKETTATYYGSNDYDVTGAQIVSEVWSCPECGETLFTSEEEANKFFEEENNTRKEVNNDGLG